MSSPPLLPDGFWELFNALDEGVICLGQGAHVLGWSNVSAELFSSVPMQGLEGTLLGDLLQTQEPDGLRELYGTADGLFQRTLITRNGDVRVHVVLRTLRFSGQEVLRILILKRRSHTLREAGASGIIGFYSLLIHEVKNPLAAIKVLVQGVELELATLPQSEAIQEMLSGYLKRVNREIDRIVKHLDSVKYLSRLTSERKSRYDLLKIARSVLSHYTPTLERQRVMCHFSAEGVGCELYGDPDEMRQVLLNLLENAVDSMREQGGDVWLTIKGEGGETSITVSDSGAGLTEVELSRLYDQRDPFRSGGLSLSVARWLIDRYRGRVSFESQKGRGTTVYVQLPGPELEAGGVG